MLHKFKEVSGKGKILTQSQIDRFNEDGFIILPAFLDANEVKIMQGIKVQAERVATENGGSFTDGKASYDVETLEKPGGMAEMALRKVQEIFPENQDFRDVMGSDKILDVVSDLIGPEVYYHSSKLMCKPAKGGRRKPWHQDYAYWSDMNTNQVTVWTAIDAATRENGCMQIIPGSHKRGLIEHHHGEDWMIDEVNISDENIEFAEMNPGDTLIFNVLALHASDPNHSSKPRLSAIIDFDSQQKPEGHKEFGSLKPLRS